ncbi:unnamed protein product [Heligmosomoides polygyrus]|uniref:EF-hand_10 domain-containing protein n=1 Tax=Heligmosomoides polygyrus TaxID=6339 RepID=A0A3P7YAZ9_HELPZ|nr:unnamed protein product [Heligmosomoides polygyrus]
MASRVADTSTTLSETTTTTVLDDEQQRRAEDLQWAEIGSPLRRVKRGKLRAANLVSIKEGKFINYYSNYFFSFLPNFLKSGPMTDKERFRTQVPITDILEIRSGYNTDNLHKAAKKYEFQEAAPQFAMLTLQERDRWVAVLNHLVQQVKEQRAYFNEKEWILKKFREADTNKNGILTFSKRFSEVWALLKKMNLQISEQYAKAMFREAEEKSTRDGVLDENEFLTFFDRLTDRPELRHVLRLVSSEGVEGVTVTDLQKFLTEEQGVSHELFPLGHRSYGSRWLQYLSKTWER